MAISIMEMRMRKKIVLTMMVFAFMASIIYCSEGSKQSQATDETMLYKQASEAEVANKFKDAVDIYKTIADKFPDSDRRDKALFMIGYLEYENLKQKDEALKYLNELLQKYPQSDLTDDAQFMIKTIESGKDALSSFKETTSDK